MPRSIQELITRQADKREAYESRQRERNVRDIVALPGDPLTGILKLFKVQSDATPLGVYKCREQVITIPATAVDVTTADVTTGTVQVVNVEEIGSSTHALAVGDFLFAILVEGDWIALTRYAKTKS